MATIVMINHDLELPFHLKYYKRQVQPRTKLFVGIIAHGHWRINVSRPSNHHTIYVPFGCKSQLQKQQTTNAFDRDLVRSVEKLTTRQRKQHARDCNVCKLDATLTRLENTNQGIAARLRRIEQSFNQIT